VGIALARVHACLLDLGYDAAIVGDAVVLAAGEPEVEAP
jgi:hypothetical protein